MKTSELLAKLKSMATKAGEAIFERARMAASVLEDKEWLAAEFQGDYDRALEVVEADCFPELSAAFSLTRLLTLVRTFPEISVWREHKFGLARLWAQHEEMAAKEKPAREYGPRAKMEDLAERDEKIKELEWSVKAARESLQAKETEVERLRRENDELRGENKAMQRMLEQMRQDRQRQFA